MFFNKFKSAATKVNSAVALGESITQDHDELRFKRSNLMDEDRLYEEAGFEPAFPDGPSLEKLLQKHEDGEMNIFANQVIRTILRKPPLKRTPRETQEVLPILRYIVKKNEFFSKYPEAVGEECLHWFRLVDVRKQQTVFHEGTRGDEMHILVHGILTICVGKETKLASDPKALKAAADLAANKPRRKTIADVLAAPMPDKKMLLKENNGGLSDSPKRFSASITEVQDTPTTFKGTRQAPRAGELPKRQLVLGTEESIQAMALLPPNSGAVYMLPCMPSKQSLNARRASMHSKAMSNISRRNALTGKSNLFKSKSQSAIEPEPEPEPAKKEEEEETDPDHPFLATQRVIVTLNHKNWCLFGELSVIMGEPRKATAYAYSEVCLLELNGSDFRAILDDKTSSKADRDYKVSLIDEHPMTDNLTPKMLYGLASQFKVKNIPEGELFCPDVFKEFHVIIRGAVQVYSFRPGIFDNMQNVLLFKEKGLLGLKEALHYEVLGNLGTTDFLSEGTLFPELICGLAMKATGSVDCIHIDVVDFRKYVPEENLKKLKKMAYRRLAEYEKVSIWPLQEV